MSCLNIKYVDSYGSDFPGQSQVYVYWAQQDILKIFIIVYILKNFVYNVVMVSKPSWVNVEIIHKLNHSSSSFNTAKNMMFIINSC